MKRYVIEREVPGFGGMSAGDLCAASRTSNGALAKLAPRVQWEHSYVVGNGTFCIYLAEDEAAVLEHAKLSGFPANRVVEVVTMIDPTTGG